MASTTTAVGVSGTRDLGLLILRIGVGASILLFHGWAKITAGPTLWESIGANMGHLGVRFFPVFWGLAAALAESIGSLLILLGLFTRQAAAVLAFTMLVAMLRHLNLPPGAANAGWAGASHALELFSVYVGLILLGPGRYALRPERRQTRP